MVQARGTSKRKGPGVERCWRVRTCGWVEPSGEQGKMGSWRTVVSRVRMECSVRCKVTVVPRAGRLVRQSQPMRVVWPGWMLLLGAVLPSALSREVVTR